MALTSLFSTLFGRHAPAAPPDAVLRSALASQDAPQAIQALAAGANPDLEVDGPPFITRRTALQHAVLVEDATLARALLAAGSSPVKATDEEWYPPTHRAVLNEHKDMCLLLANADWSAQAVDPMIGTPVSASELVLLRQRGDFAEWFATQVAPLPVSLGRAGRRVRP